MALLILAAMTIDGVVLALNDSVLLINQTTGLQNGIYTVTADGVNGSNNVILTRRPDLQTSAQALTGFYLPISAGTSFAGSMYTIVEPQINNMGFDTILFVKSDGIISNTASNAGGSATVTITDANIASTSIVFVAIRTSANAVSIQKVTPGSGSVVVLLSGDPGASTYSYEVIKK